jgi:SAM-dependent methyltransferase
MRHWGGVLFVHVCALCAAGIGAVSGPTPQTSERAASVREIAWGDIARPMQDLLARRGITSDGFSAHVADIRRRNQARMREGDLDHLVYYVLQSSSFTRLPAIEPAESAAQFAAAHAIPAPARSRIRAFVSALNHAGSNIRLSYFRDLLSEERFDAASAEAFLSGEYARAMRFLYEKEFAGKDRTPLAEGALYQARGLSTDTSVDAGFVVYLALGALRQLEPGRRIQRVLVIGPGLDLAPRTGLVETGPPQSYQPFAVMDALFRTALSDPATLRVSALDINPRVVDWLRNVHGTAPHLALHSGITETERVRLTDDYRAYFASLGETIGAIRPMRGAGGSTPIAKILQLSTSVTAAVDAALADITVERLDDRYDLIVVTNVFPYLSDPELLLALGNVVRMLKPGGVLLHNEPRPLLAEATLALGLPLIHARSAVVATVERGPSPLYDSIWMHKASD